MTDIKTNAPDSIKESLKETMTEQEAYKEAQRINDEDKDHQAKVENGELVVQNVLKG